MSDKFEVQISNSNIGLFIVVGIAYVGLIGLFAWQTSELVAFLFPASQLLIMVLTVFSFDGMAALWGALELFYKFAHPHARTAVRWGFAITNILSLTATVLYMVIQFMLRFQVTINSTTVTIGDGISIAALVFNICMLAVFVNFEFKTRWKREDDFILTETNKTNKIQGQTNKNDKNGINTNKKGRKHTDEQVYLQYENFVSTGICPWSDRSAYIRFVTRKFGYSESVPQTDELVHEN